MTLPPRKEARYDSRVRKNVSTISETPTRNLGAIGLTLVALLLSVSCQRQREYGPGDDGGAAGDTTGGETSTDTSGTVGGTGTSGNGAGGGNGTSAGNGTGGAGGTVPTDSGGAAGASECTAEEKMCDGACVAIDDPAYGCDATLCSASSCPTVTGASLACDSGVCVLKSCGAGTKKCNGTCVSSTDPAYGCGDSTCDASSCPNPGVGGSVTCEDGECVIETCPPTFKQCEGSCVSISDPNYGCGDSTCDASTCPTPGSNTLTCEDNACVIGTCGAGTKKCGNTCVPMDAQNGCSDTSRCTACASNEACGGASNTCQCVPISQNVACSGKCGSVSNGCGAMYDCGGCSQPETCNGGGVANVCGCTPVSKATACGSRNCGTASNACGSNYSCGTCGSATPFCVSGTCEECGKKADCGPNYFDCLDGACSCAPQTSVNLLTNAGFDDDKTLQGWSASGAQWTSTDSDDCPRSGAVAMNGGSITQCVHSATGGQSYTIGFRFLGASDTPVGCFGSFYSDTNCTNGVGPDFINVAGGGTGQSFWDSAAAAAPAPAGTKSIEVYCFANGGSGVVSLDQLYLSAGNVGSPSVHF